MYRPSLSIKFISQALSSPALPREEGKGRQEDERPWERCFPRIAVVSSSSSFAPPSFKILSHDTLDVPMEKNSLTGKTGNSMSKFYPLFALCTVSFLTTRFIVTQHYSPCVTPALTLGCKVCTVHLLHVSQQNYQFRTFYFLVDKK